LPLYEILRSGGIAPGGFNFDAKLRRQSTDRTDLFHAHIGGLDTLAQALLVAADLIERGRLAEMREARYMGWSGALGSAIFDGSETLASLEEKVASGTIDPGRCRTPGAARERRERVDLGGTSARVETAGAEVASSSHRRLDDGDQGGAGRRDRHRRAVGSASTASARRDRCGASRTRAWWDGAQAAIRAVLDAAVCRAGRRCDRLTGQMHGLVLLDDADRVLRPAILWNDQRTAASATRSVPRSARNA